jgi:hypothetical protein
MCAHKAHHCVSLITPEISHSSSPSQFKSPIKRLEKTCGSLSLSPQNVAIDGQRAAILASEEIAPTLITKGKGGSVFAYA